MSMSDRDGFIWQDGKMVPWREATTHVLTHSLHYGMGVFEGVRAYKTERGTAIFRLKEHTERLFRSAHIGSEKMGVSPKGAKVHVIIAAWPWGAYLGEEGMERGIRIKTSSFTRHHVNITMVRAKASGNYMNSILANNEATADGYDEALLLDPEGYVCEGAGENVFIVRNGKLYTPDLTACLEGITRATVMQLAGELGIEVIEKRITRDELYCADEAFFTGTAAEVTPIRELDGRQIGIGRRGPITAQIQAKYFDVVNGRSAQHDGWLAYI